MLAAPHRIGGRSVTLGVSAGFAVADAGKPLYDVLLRADAALYAAKATAGDDATEAAASIAWTGTALKRVRLASGRPVEAATSSKTT